MRLRASTVSDYEAMIECYLLPYFGPRKIENISRLDIERFRAEIVEATPNVIARAHEAKTCTSR